jgi:hypothetical protein
LEISDSSATEEEEGKENKAEAEEHELADSSGEDMEGVVEGRGSRKRGWEERWESAEDRDKGQDDGLGREGTDGRPKEPAGGDGDLVVEGKLRAPKRDTDLLASTVRVNQQIEEQEKMQRRLDQEAEMVRARLEIEARLQGQEVAKAAPPHTIKPLANPRLDLAAARRQADTTSGSDASSGGEGGQGGKNKKQGKTRRRKSASRTPRGRTQGQDTMD